MKKFHDRRINQLKEELKGVSSSKIRSKIEAEIAEAKRLKKQVCCQVY